MEIHVEVEMTKEIDRIVLPASFTFTKASYDLGQNANIGSIVNSGK